MTGKANARFDDQSASATLASDAGRSYRHSPRTPAHRPIAIYSRLRGGRTGRAVARLRDYSASGIGLVAEQPVEAGTHFAVRLVNPDGTKVALVFEVVYCQSGGQGAYQIGARLPQRKAPAPPRKQGFATSIMGQTVSGWERLLEMRCEGDRLWLNMRPPHSESGWGLFVDRDQIEAALFGDAPTGDKRAA